MPRVEHDRGEVDLKLARAWNAGEAPRPAMDSDCAVAAIVVAVKHLRGRYSAIRPAMRVRKPLAMSG